MIVTFYSYKGGVGRSMAVANVADILARRGLKVLMIDFDLEAPGLEQFFQINQSAARRHLGLLDLILSYKHSMSRTGGSEEEAPFRQLSQFIFPVYEKIPGGGRLDMLPAGQREEAAQLEKYALNLRAFDWQDFFYNWEGELFFEWLRHSLVPEKYDAVLVDSRTGVTEMGGICAYQLADVIVMFCAANQQNIQGTLNMARDFTSPAVRALRRSQPLGVVVVPARIEQHDEALKRDFFKRFDGAFSSYLPEPLKEAGVSFRELMIPYEPEYAFEERVLTDPARADERRKIGAAFHRLAETTALLAQGGTKLASLVPRLPPEKEAPEKKKRPPAPAPPEAQYNVAQRFAGYDVFIDYGREDRSLATELAAGLKKGGLTVFMDVSDIPSGVEFRAVRAEALFHSRALLFCVGGSGIGPGRDEMIKTALSAASRESDLRIVPVLLPGSKPEGIERTALAKFHWADLREGFREDVFSRLIKMVVGPAREPAKAEVDLGSPFMGARLFDEQNADFFFGREKIIQSLLAKVAGERAVAVVGPSGCGKTSLIRAGLFPALRRGVLPGKRWTIAALRPGESPLENLAETLFSLQFRRSLENILAALEQDEQGLAGLVDDLLPSPPDPGEGTPNLLLFIDQFEEIFTLCREEEREKFFAHLVSLSERKEAKAALLIAIRADFFSRFAEHPRLGPLLQASRFDVPAMAPEEVRQVIEKPAEKAGLAFEPGLVDRILTDIQYNPGALPLLQFMLFQLWERRKSGWLTNAAYEEMGGVRGALAWRAEQIYSSFSEEEQIVARWVFLNLIQPGEGAEDTWRREALEEMLPAGVRTDENRSTLYRSVVRKLVEARLLIAGEEGGQRIIEPIHGSLIRGWDRLRKWVEEDREFLLWRQRLRGYVADWMHGGEDPKALLGGAPLEEALNRSQSRREELSAREQGYIEESRRVSRQQKRRTIIRAIMGWVLIVSLVYVVWGYYHSCQESRDIQKAANLVGRGDDLAAAGKNDEAVQQYTLAVRSNPNDVQAYLKRGNAYFRESQFAPAIADFSRALKMDPNNPDAHLNRGISFLQMGQGDQAIADFDEAVRLKPNDASIYLNRGLALDRIDRTEEAIQSYSRAVEIQPALAEAYFNRGAAREKLGRRNEAIQDFKRIGTLENVDPQMAKAAQARLQQLGYAVTPEKIPVAPTGLYLSFADQTDQEVVNRLTQKLLNKGVAMRDVRFEKMRTKGEVQFFFRQDEKRAFEAKSITESALAEEGISVRLEIIYRDAKERPGRKPGDIEVWLPPLSRRLPEVSLPAQRRY
jgi:tetratricopeptide (TPR) repeat protein